MDKPAAPPTGANPLTAQDWTDGVETDRQGSMYAEISNAMVGLKKQYYGRGPTKAKTFINENYVLCVLEGGLTRNEETLLQAGQEDLVRTYRLSVQAGVADIAVGAVEELVGRRVIGYHSQIVFDPTKAFEIFALEPASGP